MSQVNQSTDIPTVSSMTSWQQELRQLVTNYDELMDLLQLPVLANPEMTMAMQQFPLRVPRSYLAKMTLGDWHDPLLRQVLPLGIEMAANPGYQLQPLNEKDYNPVPGLIHKYQSRVLLTVTGTCAINCRYCFRRHFDYQTVSQAQWQQAVEYIAANPKIKEVILSGGDPLAVPDRVLTALIKRLETVPHLHYLRIHSRLPVVIPSRITSSLLQWLAATRFKTSLVIHCNHPQEIDMTMQLKFTELRNIGVTLLNQTVLLKTINDQIDILESLSYRLYDVGVLPYYLHVLDKVQGAAHFEISDARAIELHQGLLTALPGYLVPKLVREVPGVGYKVPVANKKYN